MHVRMCISVNNDCKYRFAGLMLMVAPFLKVVK